MLARRKRKRSLRRTPSSLFSMHCPHRRRSRARLLLHQRTRKLPTRRPRTRRFLLQRRLRPRKKRPPIRMLITMTSRCQVLKTLLKSLILQRQLARRSRSLVVVLFPVGTRSSSVQSRSSRFQTRNPRHMMLVSFSFFADGSGSGKPDQRNSHFSFGQGTVDSRHRDHFRLL